MRQWRPSMFQQRFFNFTRRESEILGEIYNPEKQVTAFEEVVRLLRCARTAAVQGGDHLYISGAHYVVSAHSEGPRMKVFRLISLPENLTWSRRPVTELDPVTGLYRVPATPPETRTIWVRELTKGFSKENPNLDFEKRVRRFILGDTVEAGDLLDGVIIKRLWVEQGVVLAET